jgi:hypothetical protein
MIFLKSGASASLIRTGRVALTAFGLIAGAAALATLPMIGLAHADHGQGGGHDNGGHDNSGHGADHSGPGRGAGSRDNRGPGHDDAADHDANDDRGGVAGGHGTDDPADHDANDDNGNDGATLPTTTAN